jgi:hypothetical protein
MNPGYTKWWYLNSHLPLGNVRCSVSSLCGAIRKASSGERRLWAALQCLAAAPTGDGRAVVVLTRDTTDAEIVQVYDLRRSERS